MTKVQDLMGHPILGLVSLTGFFYLKRQHAGLIMVHGLVLDCAVVTEAELPLRPVTLLAHLNH